MITSYEAMCRIDPQFHQKVDQAVSKLGVLIESAVEESLRNPKEGYYLDISPFVTNICLSELEDYVLRKTVIRRLRDLGWELHGKYDNMSVYVDIHNSPI